MNNRSAPAGLRDGPGRAGWGWGPLKLDFFERNASVALNTVVTETERRSRGMEFAKWQRRKVAVFGSGALFPYGERVSLGRRGGLQWEP